MNPLKALSGRINYSFQQPELLKQALTHRSLGYNNNERLEFLGDSVLGFVVSAMLYEKFPSAAEGDLSRTRARLVRGESLAEIARELEFGAALLLGAGEMKSGGYRRDSILADALEAVIGAIYLDGGFEVCEKWLQQLFSKKVDELPPLDELKDPKTRLQEWLQGRKLALPSYEVTKVAGKGHLQQFTVRCQIESLELELSAQGTSRRKAEQSVADSALQKIMELNR
ncbi:MAG: ribonuclease III [Thiotrichales bacterium]|nr:ribonuclease III [Thiotrichales bacterium]MBT3613688.1 ribonuclease III [Thiotrichales bacterium]MBT3752550.1 ribonuclease III [Thiotrichales bacterium]MBT3836708.1 ribonuclease III [Thiotrichales bacterium]MBT4152915.1 ribonuclease III [Thiotrichales bacterium]